MVQVLSLSGIPKSLDEGLQRVCGVKVIKPYTKVFPDGEQYLRVLEDIREKVYVLQSMYPDQDRKLIELYLAIDAIKGLGVAIEGVVIPYVAYARQDKRFLSGEPISVIALYQGLKLYNINRVITVDVHSPEPFLKIGFELINIVPHPYMAKHSSNPIDYVLAPDKGALHRAQITAKELGVPVDHLDKYRDRVTGEIAVKSKELDVVGKSVAIVDDIVSTGKTLAKATESLYKAGAKSVTAIIPHAMLSNSSIELFENVGLKELIIANSIEQKIALPKWIKVVDISPLICRNLI